MQLLWPRRAPQALTEVHRGLDTTLGARSCGSSFENSFTNVSLCTAETWETLEAAVVFESLSCGL